MKTLIDIQKKLVPDLLEVLKTRYSLLHLINQNQPIGRRGLTDESNLTERQVRSEIDFLHEQGLIEVTTKGMLITDQGKDILEKLTQYIAEISELNQLEIHLKEILRVENVIIVPGNSDEEDWVKQEMGKACVRYLKKIIMPNATIAVTGGTTMASIASVMSPLDKVDNYLFVPARGGIGEKVENQANTIAAEMSLKAQGNYRLLYVPDPLSETSYQNLINEPSIIEVLQLIKNADIVLHGIGDALTMAERRKTPENIKQKLLEEKAVSEAFGYYFTQKGEVVHKVRTVGLQLEDLDSKEYVITVAGGSSKAKAIESYFKQAKSHMLITDEAAAIQILRDSSL
ncbi:sugar-binding transcriptional regulator [Ornithinibacillus halotolerans]|uniref:Central glycolytic genes regulator n=1 Tax=Ornithinibacillus halotolerans TaxID=1274357 RepID=A0A916W4N3_9BACI|nr:sugar-binding domain-containing protein [Ornithinibacillus halotolerans]GGA67467.1 central glycolytic genes regulator [Ornithinibacillus halotolerans]